MRGIFSPSPQRENQTMKIKMFLLAFLLLAVPMMAEDIVINNANIMTVTNGTIRNASLLIRDGKIAAIGTSVTTPAGARIIDAGGKWLTPGIIDCHSHIGADSINEGSISVSSMTGIEDVLDATDINIYRDLAGGVTTANILHGSANPIGGKNQVVKLRWGKGTEGMKFAGAKPGIKFALGENTKRRGMQQRGQPSTNLRYPGSRMGVEDVIRDSFQKAKEYMESWEAYEKKKAARERALPPRKDYQLEALAEILRGDRLVHSHSYRADEIAMLIRVADDYGFQIATFQHVLEGYKVANEIAAHGAGASTFSDWWAYKVEAYDAIPYNAAIMTGKGVTVSINSDSAEEARHLNQEAAKAMRYGGLDENQALALVTLNAAKQLRIDDRVGSLEVGKDADIVMFNNYPLSVYAVPDTVFIDGEIYFSDEIEEQRLAQLVEEKQRLLAIEEEEEGDAQKKKATDVDVVEPAPAQGGQR